MGLAEIISSVLSYGFNINLGGGDFTLGVSVVGFLALIAAGWAFAKYGKNLPLVGKK